MHWWFSKDLNFSIYWIFRANRIPFNECTCRQSAQLEFNPKDYAAGHEQQSVETCCSLFLMLQRAVVLDIEDMQLLIYKAMPWEWLERMIPYSCRRKEHPVSQNEITLISFLIPDYQSLSPSQNISSVLSLEWEHWCPPIWYPPKVRSPTPPEVWTSTPLSYQVFDQHLTHKS